MAVYSMTGYANVLGTPTDGGVGHAATVAIELRSVNSRFLDLAFRLPDEFRGLEGPLRELLTAGFRRGKIELRLAEQREREAAWPQPQSDQLMQLGQLQATVRDWLPESAPLSVNEVLNLCRGGGGARRSDEDVLAVAKQAVAALREARAREGARLVEMLLDRIGQLRALAAQAAPLVPQVVQRQQARFLERWNEALAAAGAGALDADAVRERALSEATAFAIRIDVAEELTRLAAHLDEIERLLKAGGELGKRLDFMIQELHREANTLGSKAAALELTQISVEMRVLVEQMREQVQNIE